MLFRFRYHEEGGHTHVRTYAGQHSRGLALCGTLVFRNNEFAVFRAEVESEATTRYGSRFEFLPDHMPPPTTETPP
jgi:hypothetical protein